MEFSPWDGAAAAAGVEFSRRGGAGAGVEFLGRAGLPSFSSSHLLSLPRSHREQVGFLSSPFSFCVLILPSLLLFVRPD